MNTTDKLDGQVMRIGDVVLIDVRNGGDWIDDGGDGLRWWTLHLPHDGCVGHRSKADARSWMDDPADWCPICQDGDDY